MTADSLILVPGALTLETLRRLADGNVAVSLPAGSRAEVETGLSIVRTALAEGRQTYGVNTGFGALANRVISDDDVEELQRRLVLSNACGTGPLLADGVVRMVLGIKIAALATGHSGVRP